MFISWIWNNRLGLQLQAEFHRSGDGSAAGTIAILRVRSRESHIGTAANSIQFFRSQFLDLVALHVYLLLEHHLV